MRVYYSSQVASQCRPGEDVEDIKVDMRLSVLKPLHAKCVAKAYTWLKTEAGQKNIQSSWLSCGIKAAVKCQ